MSITAFSGSLSSGWDPANPELGPSMFGQGSLLADPRPFYNYDPGQNFGALNAGWNSVGRVTTINAIPMTLSATLITAAVHTVGGTAMTLASATVDGLVVGVTVPRSDTGALVSKLLKLDPQVASVQANLTLGSNVMTVTSVNAAGGHCYNQLCAGMVLTDATTAGNLPTGTTVVGWSPNGGGTGGGLIGTYTLSSNATATATGDTVTGIYTGSYLTVPFGSAGTIQAFNPGDMISRGISVTSTTSQVVQTFTVNGLDVFGYPLTEVITLSGTSATTTNGKKAFKYILSVTPSVTDGTGSYSIGTTSIVGFPIRTDNWQAAAEYDVTIMSNNALIAANTGYTSAVLTTATGATGDVRGTFALQTSANGTLRFLTTQTPLVPNLGSAAGLYGVPQFASF